MLWGQGIGGTAARVETPLGWEERRIERPNGGELLLKDSDTNATLTIGNGTLNGGRINGVDSNRRITNTNPMTVQGEIQVQLVSGQTITLA